MIIGLLVGLAITVMLIVVTAAFVAARWGRK